MEHWTIHYRPSKSGEPMDGLDNQKFSVPCPSCKTRIENPLRWFKENGHHCPECCVELTSGQFRWDVEEAERQLSRLLELEGTPPLSEPFSISSSCPAWPNGKPVRSEPLPDGKMRHVLEDGRVFTVGKPTYRLDYLSTWVGSAPGETYSVNIAIAGLSSVEGFFEVWNFDIEEPRNYAFRKTVRITHLETAEEFTGEEVETFLKSQLARK